MDDQLMLDLFHARKESVIEEARHKYGRRLFKTAFILLHNREDAEECVNDTLMKAWEALIPPFRPEKLNAYLTKIARNLSINKWEAKSAEKRGGGEITFLLTELEECISTLGKPEEAYETSQTVAAINSFLYTLNQQARVVFTRRYFYGESISAISERFQMSESKVKSMLFRVRNKLKIYLENEGVAI